MIPLHLDLTLNHKLVAKYFMETKPQYTKESRFKGHPIFMIHLAMSNTPFIVVFMQFTVTILEILFVVLWMFDTSHVTLCDTLQS